MATRSNFKTGDLLVANRGGANGAKSYTLSYDSLTAVLTDFKESDTSVYLTPGVLNSYLGLTPPTDGSSINLDSRYLNLGSGTGDQVVLGTGSVTFSGKVFGLSTVTADTATTLVTKDYVDAALPVVISQDTAPTFVEDAIWFDTTSAEAYFGYKDADDDEYWISLSKPGPSGAKGSDGINGIDGIDGIPVVISQDTKPPFQEDAIWFNTSSGEAFFGYEDPSGDEYWISLSKVGPTGAKGADGINGINGTPVVISQDTAPAFVEDAIWFNTSNGEAYFGYKDPSGDEYWISLSKVGPAGAKGSDGINGIDGIPVVISQDTTPVFVEDSIWFDTSTAEAFFGYKDPSGDEYWISLSKPGPDGAKGADGINGINGNDGIPVVISQDTAPVFQEDAIWFDTSSEEAFFGYKHGNTEEWTPLSKVGPAGADGADGVTVSVSDNPPAGPVNGQIWQNSSNGKSYTYWSSSSIWVSL